jgi:outer membrane immunogenic protein
MRSVVVLVALGIIASRAAIAGDLAPAPPPPIPTAYDWTGLYIGAHAGGSWEKTEFSDPSSYNIYNLTTGATPPASIFLSGPTPLSMSTSSFVGGLQTGANVQVGKLVLGTELDYSWTSMKGSMNGALPPAPGSIFTGSETFGFRTQWIATATTRLGVARDTWMLYGKAGAAWTGGNYTLSTADAGVGAGTLVGGFSGSSAQDTRTGWTLGTGIEWAFARNFTVRLEYDFIDFGTWSETIPVTGAIGGAKIAANSAISISEQISEVKFGINYKTDPGFLFW